MSLSVLEPSPVTLSPEVKRIAVVNRSYPDQQGKALDIVDKIFTLEGANLDKLGSEATVAALVAELSVSARFDEVKESPATVKGNNNPGGYAYMLSWPEVEQICKESGADVLFSLELFDTDSKIAYSASPVKVNTPLGDAPAIHQEAKMTTRVKAGWRIYDPSLKLVLDESAVSRQLVFRGKGINPLLAAKALIERKEAVRQVGNMAGIAYAYSVIPAWTRVSRQYFVKGNNSFKIARRKAESGNWDGAGQIWLDQTKDYKGKVAGRACYNMAIISEVNGKLDEAIRWAQQSYEDYNTRLALRYVKMLQDRKVRNHILKYQESGELASGQIVP